MAQVAYLATLMYKCKPRLMQSSLFMRASQKRRGLCGVQNRNKLKPPIAAHAEETPSTPARSKITVIYLMFGVSILQSFVGKGYDHRREKQVPMHVIEIFIIHPPLPPCQLYPYPYLHVLIVSGS